eukprot:Gb_20537 [translate_table: standard]
MRPTQQVNFALMAQVLNAEEPTTYEEASKEEKWVKAMDAGMQAVQKNQTWDLVRLPEGKQTIGYRWVFKTKYKSDGSVDKYKARLVAKGFKQKEGIDYQETFAPVAKMITIRVVIALAAQFQWELHQMDVKSAFLNGDLTEEVYMEQPPGFQVKGKESLVCRLKKDLYGLKQAPRAWYQKIDDYFTKNGYKKSSSDLNLYIKVRSGRITSVTLYVDDLIITGNIASMIEGVKEDLKRSFEMSDLGLLHYYLGVEVWQRPDQICMSQAKYTWEILKRFRMEDYKPAPTPMETGVKLSAYDEEKSVDGTLFHQLVGSLIYLTTTRPDIIFVVGMISSFMTSPKQSH